MKKVRNIGLCLLCVMLLSRSGAVFPATPVTPVAPHQAVVRLSASVSSAPPKITLSWVNPYFSSWPTGAQIKTWAYKVYRKQGLPGFNWTLLATTENHFYEDAGVEAGVDYEYKVAIAFYNDTTGALLADSGYTGYIYSGIALPPVENRGKIILLIDYTYAQALADEIARLVRDLRGDGWQVIRHDVERAAPVTDVKSLIVEAYNDDPENVKGVFLLGHLPVPYSGLSVAPDGHGNHAGAWPADAYYGEIDGIWTDAQTAEGAARAANKNYPGDGKFDQNALPSDLELFVGRVDLTAMPAFAPKNELGLLRQYLDKDHQFRHNRMNIQKRALIDDHFGTYTASAQYGWYNFSALYGPANIHTDTAGYTATAATESYMWVHGGGGSGYTVIGNPDPPGTPAKIASVQDFASADPKTAFHMFFGSYFVDWDNQDNALRAPLCTSTGLMSVWGARPGWIFHHAAMGLPVGYAQLATMNHTGAGRYQLYANTGYVRGIHIGMMGDPTLRIDTVSPPSHPQQRVVDGRAELSWAPSPDAGIMGYNVYAADAPDGLFTRVNDELITDPVFLDAAPYDGHRQYMVRAQKLTVSASGSYHNLSQGVFFDTDSGAVPLRADYDAAAGLVTIEGESPFQRETEVTMIALPRGEQAAADFSNLAYLDQQRTEKDGRFTFRFQMRDLDALGSYDVLAGGTNVARVEYGKFIFTGAIRPNVYTEHYILKDMAFKNNTGAAILPGSPVPPGTSSVRFSANVIRTSDSAGKGVRLIGALYDGTGLLKQISVSRKPAAALAQNQAVAMENVLDIPQGIDLSTSTYRLYVVTDDDSVMPLWDVSSRP